VQAILRFNFGTCFDEVQGVPVVLKQPRHRRDQIETPQLTWLKRVLVHSLPDVGAQGSPEPSAPLVSALRAWKH